jgi:hypothetical protein
MELFFIYLWLKLDVITTFVIVTGVLLLVGLGICQFVMACEKQKWMNHFKKLVALGGLIILCGNMIPSQKETAILVGSHYAIALANSPEGVKVQNLIRKKANEYLDAELKAK